MNFVLNISILMLSAVNASIDNAYPNDKRLNKINGLSNKKSEVKYLGGLIWDAVTNSEQFKEYLEKSSYALKSLIDTPESKTEFFRFLDYSLSGKRIRNNSFSMVHTEFIKRLAVETADIIKNLVGCRSENRFMSNDKNVLEELKKSFVLENRTESYPIVKFDKQKGMRLLMDSYCNSEKHFIGKRSLDVNRAHLANFLNNERLVPIPILHHPVIRPQATTRAPSNMVFSTRPLFPGRPSIVVKPSSSTAAPISLTTTPVPTSSTTSILDEIKNNTVVVGPEIKNNTVVVGPEIKDNTVIVGPEIKDNTVVVGPEIKNNTVVVGPEIKNNTVIMGPEIKDNTVIVGPEIKDNTVVVGPEIKDNTVVVGPEIKNNTLVVGPEIKNNTVVVGPEIKNNTVIMGPEIKDNTVRPILPNTTVKPITIVRPGTTTVKPITIVRPGTTTVKPITIVRPGTTTVKPITIVRPGTTTVKPTTLKPANFTTIKFPEINSSIFFDNLSTTEKVDINFQNFTDSTPVLRNTTNSHFIHSSTVSNPSTFNPLISTTARPLCENNDSFYKDLSIGVLGFGVVILCCATFIRKCLPAIKGSCFFGKKDQVCDSNGIETTNRIEGEIVELRVPSNY